MATRGTSVHIGARIAEVAGSGLGFEDHGTAALKGIPGDSRLYTVRPG